MFGSLLMLVAIVWLAVYAIGPLGYFTTNLIELYSCLLYTSDAADERSSVDLGGRRIIKKKTNVDLGGSRNIKKEYTYDSMTEMQRVNVNAELHGTIATGSKK